jgi:lysophospholipase L1-like esterase
VKQQLALAVAAILVGLLIAESVSRVLGINPGYGQLLPLDDPRAPEAARSPIRTVDGVVLWQIQNPRARPEDIARVAEARDAFIVLGLGDSIMYGMALTKEETYLEQMRLALAGRSTRPIEVLNLAVSGYNTAQEDAVHRELGDRLAPNLVLLHYWSDDGRLYRAVGGYVVDIGDMLPDGRLVVRALPVSASINDFLLVHSRLYQLLTHAVVTYDRRVAGNDWSRVAEPLVALNERVRRAGGRLVVLASPELDSEAVRANRELPLLRELAASHHFEVVDLSAWLDGVPAATIRMDGCHFNANGHRLIGEHLAEYVLARDIR